MINDDKKEMTARDVSVSADAEQSNPICTTNSIDNWDNDFKTMDEVLRDLQKELERKNDPAFLEVVSMNQLYDNVYESKTPLIEGLLYEGTYLFVGAPKLGKSFMMAQLAYHVGTGTPLWGLPVKKSKVLYLALEDTYKRLQDRLYRMFGTEGTDNVFFSVSAGKLGEGLDEQLTQFMKEQPDTKLIIIDTLQKVRETGGENYSYASDYQIITRLKSFADVNGVCIIIVHHTRKQQSNDKFDSISGTNGLLGAADGAFILTKEKRTSNSAVLDVSGRDQPDQRFRLVRNQQTLVWEFDKAEIEIWEEPSEPVLEEIAKRINADNPCWMGSPTELVEYLGIDMKANALTLRLNVNVGNLKEDYHIKYENKRFHDGRKVRLTFLQE